MIPLTAAHAFFQLSAVSSCRSSLKALQQLAIRPLNPRLCGTVPAGLPAAQSGGVLIAPHTDIGPCPYHLGAGAISGESGTLISLQISLAGNIASHHAAIFQNHVMLDCNCWDCLFIRGNCTAYLTGVYSSTKLQGLLKHLLSPCMHCAGIVIGGLAAILLVASLGLLWRRQVIRVCPQACPPSKHDYKSMFICALCTVPYD